jgi:hypothetical protein
MYFGTNSIINNSRHDIWCAYSVGDKNGDGWDDWRVRLLRNGWRSSLMWFSYQTGCPKCSKYYPQRR